MARRKSYNPERRRWRGVSYKKGRLRVKRLREEQDRKIALTSE